MLSFFPIFSLFSLFHLVTATTPLIAQYWPAYGTQTPSQIRWNATDIAYYFVTVTTATGFKIPDGQSVSAMQEFVAEATTNNVQPVFTVGGWDGGLYFSSLVGSPANQTAFANQLKSFMDQYGFAGVDIDWEYPNGDGIGCNQRSPADAANLLAFLKVLRATIGTGKLITAAVALTGFNGPDGSPVKDLKPYGDLLDYINLMSYDVAGSWSQSTGPNGNLASCSSGTGAIAGVQAWLTAGFPASKILLGIPAYGHSFTTVSSTLAVTTIGNYSSKLYQAKESTTPKGDITDVKGTGGGTDVCGHTSTGPGGYSGQWQYTNLISGGVLSPDGLTGQGGYTRYWDECTSTPFLFNPSTKELIAYEDAKSASAKASYAVAQGLAGVMIFDSTGFTGDVYTTLQATLDGGSPSSPPRPAAAASSSSATPVPAVAPASASSSAPVSASASATKGSSAMTSQGIIMEAPPSSAYSASIAPALAAAPPSASSGRTASTQPQSGSPPLPSPPLPKIPLVPFDAASTQQLAPLHPTTASSDSQSNSLLDSPSASSGALVRCDSPTRWSLCDDQGCTGMGNVADGTICVGGSIIDARSTRRMVKMVRR